MKLMTAILLLSCLSGCQIPGGWFDEKPRAKVINPWFSNYYGREEAPAWDAFYGKPGGSKSNACSFYGNCK